MFYHVTLLLLSHNPFSSTRSKLETRNLVEHNLLWKTLALFNNTNREEITRHYVKLLHFVIWISWDENLGRFDWVFIVHAKQFIPKISIYLFLKYLILFLKYLGIFIPIIPKSFSKNF